MHPLFRSLAGCLMAGAACPAEIVIKGEHSTATLAYARDVSATDLINVGRPTLESASVSPCGRDYLVGGINDGAYSNDKSANSFFESGVHFPATATYRLNLVAAPNGYDIRSITSLMGWGKSSQMEANQDYTVEVSVVGAAGFRPLAHVKYTPFPAATRESYESKVTLTEDATGVLAKNVSAIRFLFSDPGKIGKNPGTLLREIDVTGTPSVTTPPVAAVQTVTDFSVTDDAYAGEVVNDDLVNRGQLTLAAFKSSSVPGFALSGVNDGIAGQFNTAAAAWYKPEHLPSTLTFDLNTTAAPKGYVVSSIRTYAGWKNGGTQCYANQKYTVEYRKVGGDAWLPLTTVDFSPFSSLEQTPASTKVELSAPKGNLLSGVAAVRFNLQVPTRAYGNNNGTVLQEIDVIGYPVKASDRR